MMSLILSSPLPLSHLSQLARSFDLNPYLDTINVAAIVSGEQLITTIAGVNETPALYYGLESVSPHNFSIGDPKIALTTSRVLIFDGNMVVGEAPLHLIYVQASEDSFILRLRREGENSTTYTVKLARRDPYNVRLGNLLIGRNNIHFRVSEYLIHIITLLRL
jgi:hypothetical protein